MDRARPVRRERLAQQAPDLSLDWRTFPRSGLPVGRRLYRAARHTPWWFCACGGCRFDLDEPRGTCYLATDPVSGLLESIGPEWATGRPLTRAFVTGRTVHALDLPQRVTLANLTSRKAIGFRVTNELSDMTPYDVPHAFATLFDGGDRPKRARVRRPPVPQPFGHRRYDPRGGVIRRSRRADVVDLREVDEPLLDELRALGVLVTDPPALADLHQAPDP